MTFNKITQIFLKFKHARKEIAWVIFGQLLVFIGGLVGIKMLTTFMGTVAYGQLALGMTIAGVLNLFIYGPISQTVLRFFSIYRERKELDIYIAVLKRTHMRAAFIAFFIITILMSCLLINGSMKYWLLLGVTAILFGIVGGVNGSLLSIQNAARQRKSVALHQGADYCLRPILALGAMFVAGNSGYVALFGFMLGTLFISLSQWRYISLTPKLLTTFKSRSKLSSELLDSNFHEMRKYATPFLYFSVAAVISMYGDRWILQGLFGEREVGIYAAMYQLASAPLTVISAIVSQFIVPIVFDESGNHTIMAKAVIISLVLNLMVVSGLFVFGGFIMNTFTTTDFAVEQSALWIMALGISFFNVGQLLVVKGLHRNMPYIYIAPKFLQALSLLIFSYVFVQHWGIMGMAISITLSSLVYVIYVILINSKLVK